MAIPELVQIDANTVVIDTNVRDDASDLAADFIESIRQHGVLVPTLGYRDGTGVVHIRAGQRRTLAAQQTGQPLPVVVADRGDAEADRIIQQLIENDQREDLSPSQRIKGWSQLALAGMTVPRIAKALGAPKAQVTAAIGIAKNDLGLQLADSYDIDLIQLAETMSFADDPETQNGLLEVAVEEPDMFEHALEQARQRRSQREAFVAHCEELEAAGKKVIRSWADVDRSTTAHVSSLERYDDIEITAEGDPDIRILPQQRFEGFIDTELMVNHLSYGYDHKRYGGEQRGGPMSDEQKAERKLLIRRNKEWDAATAVRVRWLADFLGRRTFPKDCGAFVATSLGRYGRELNEKGQSLSQELLGLDRMSRGYQQSPLADLVDEQPAKAGLVTLAIVLGQFESNTSRETWRNPNKMGRAYLEQLAAWGYGLSPVERLAAGQEVADEDVTFAASDDAEDEDLAEAS